MKDKFWRLKYWEWLVFESLALLLPKSMQLSWRKILELKFDSCLKVWRPALQIGESMQIQEKNPPSEVWLSDSYLNFTSCPQSCWIHAISWKFDAPPNWWIHARSLSPKSWLQVHLVGTQDSQSITLCTTCLFNQILSPLRIEFSLSSNLVATQYSSTKSFFPFLPLLLRLFNKINLYSKTCKK